MNELEARRQRPIDPAVARATQEVLRKARALHALDHMEPSGVDPIEAAAAVRESRLRGHSKANVAKKIAAIREWLDAFEGAWRR